MFHLLRDEKGISCHCVILKSTGCSSSQHVFHIFKLTVVTRRTCLADLQLQGVQLIKGPSCCPLLSAIHWGWQGHPNRPILGNSQTATLAQGVPNNLAEVSLDCMVLSFLRTLLLKLPSLSPSASDSHFGLRAISASCSSFLISSHMHVLLHISSCLGSHLSEAPD